MTISRRSPRLARAVAAVVVAAAFQAGCRQDMHDAPKYEPLERSTFFADKRASRPLVEGTVARGQLREDSLLYTGRDGEAFSETFPFPVTLGVLQRGRERFDIYCSPCHSRAGDGLGMIVERGYKQPPSFHEDRLVASAPGYFVTVINNGFATMPSYALQVRPNDRWAIAAYIKALQSSRRTAASELTAEERLGLDKPPVEEAAADEHAKEAHGG